jgi:hypothetical protein
MKIVKLPFVTFLMRLIITSARRNTPLTPLEGNVINLRGVREVSKAMRWPNL